MRAPASLLARVLDQIKLPVFLFEGVRQIYANAAAVELAERLRSADRIELRVVLLDHISALESARGADTAVLPTVTLLTSQSGEPFYLHVLPVTRHRRRHLPTYAITVRARGADVHAFRRRYRLSARESQITELDSAGIGQSRDRAGARHHGDDDEEAPGPDFRQSRRRQPQPVDGEARMKPGRPLVYAARLPFRARVMTRLSTLILPLAVAVGMCPACSRAGGDAAGQPAPAGAAHAIVQPGAPGQASTVVSNVPAFNDKTFTDADVKFMQGMIHHHHQALLMVAMIPTHTTTDQLLAFGHKIDLSQTSNT